MNLIYVKFRVFPLGNYTRLTLKEGSVVGNLHVLSNDQSKVVEIMSWHPLPITEMVTQNETNQNVTNQNITNQNVTK